MKYSIFTKPPEDFFPSIQVSACYCQHGDKVLLLKRHPSSPQGGTWGVPAGKLEKGEMPREAVIREILEEIGVDINDFDLMELGKLYCRLPHVDYIYHAFRKEFKNLPKIELALSEHTEMKWVTFQEALELPLIAGGREALIYFQKSSIYFVRHGQADYPQFVGPHDEPDVSLTKKGVEQAKSLKLFIDTLPIRTICVSPLKRALETASIIAAGHTCKIELIEEFRECTAQVWDDMTNNRPSKDVVKFIERVALGLDKMLSLPGPRLLVAHGGVHYAICELFNIEHHEKLIDHCAPVHLSFDGPTKGRALKMGIEGKIF